MLVGVLGDRAITTKKAHFDPMWPAHVEPRLTGRFFQNEPIFLRAIFAVWLSGIRIASFGSWLGFCGALAAARAKQVRTYNAD